jgi:ribosomal-protein-alanine N-acetyltransferase
MNQTPFIDGSRIYLRALSVADLDGGYVDWLNDAEVSAHNSHHVFPYSVEEARAHIADMQDLKRNLVLAMVAKDTEKHIGNISLQSIDYISHTAEYAIMVGDKEYWGKGIASEASRLILAHGFNALNLHRIYCGTSSTNEAMQKLALALGFTQEGVRREAMFKAGGYVDIIEYGMLVGELNAS